MPKNKKNCACKSLAGSKITILVLEKEKQTSDRLRKLLKISGLYSSTKLSRNQGIKQIKCHDIYVFASEEMPFENKIRIIKKIYKSNPKACVFLLGETKDAKNIISEEVQPYIDPIKLGVVFESTELENDEELNSVIKYISSIEKTKKKIMCLWQKLETA